MNRRLIDLSHEIEDGMVTYPGLPVPKIREWLSREASSARYAPGTTFQLGTIELLANTGTYIDAPSHRYAEGNDVAGAALVGIDSLNIDDDSDGTRPVHTTLLAAGIAIVEHLCGLDRLPESGFRFFAAPPKVRGIGSFPVRAFALVER